MDNFIAIYNRFLFKITNHAKLYIRDYKSLIIFPWRLQNSCKRGQNHACVSYAEKLSKRELEQIHLFIAEKLSKREHEQTHLFIAEKLSKRELEQTHLFIAECSQLWIKSVQPALDKISAAENGRSQTCREAATNHK